MNNADYWARRFKISEEAILNDAYKSVQEVERVCEAAIADCDTLIRAWYQRLAANNNVSYTGARKLLVADELEEFKWTVREYIKKGEENAISGEWAKHLENASARHHISKYEALKLQLQHYAELVSQARAKVTTDAAKRAYTDSYYHTAFEIQRGFGAGYSFGTVDDAMLDKMLAKPWTVDGQTFSARIWGDRNKLVDTIQQELTRMLVTGSATPDKAIAAIASKFKTAKENAGRLVMTESSYFASIGQRDCYKELDVERYQVVGTLDNGTCDKCSELDGQVFPMSAYQPGLTANPFHPWCRCCTAPYFADMEGVGERYARDIETGKAYAVPRDMTYEQWKASQDEKYGAGAVDKNRKMRYNKSADEAQYQRYKDVLKELAPKSIEEFQEIKYSDAAKWGTLKHQYRTLNMYELNAGHMSQSDILSLDEKLITEKRTKFTSKYKKSGNIAGAYVTYQNGSREFYIAHSQIDDAKAAAKYKGSARIVCLKQNLEFSYIDVRKSDGKIRGETYRDTEAKLFEAFSDIHTEKKIAEIQMLSERGMCDSCKGVMRQFSEMYPDIKISVVSNKKVEGNVWKYRKRKDPEGKK